MVNNNQTYDRDNQTGFKFTKIDKPGDNRNMSAPMRNREYIGDIEARPAETAITRAGPMPEPDILTRAHPAEVSRGPVFDHAPPRMQSDHIGTQAADERLPFRASPYSRVPTTLESDYYTAGYLEEYIGHRMRVEFLIGTNGPLVDRTGRLVRVGASYIVLEPTDTDDLLFCDLYSIKFVTIYR